MYWTSCSGLAKAASRVCLFAFLVHPMIPMFCRFTFWYVKHCLWGILRYYFERTKTPYVMTKDTCGSTWSLGDISKTGRVDPSSICNPCNLCIKKIDTKWCKHDLCHSVPQTLSHDWHSQRYQSTAPPTWASASKHNSLQCADVSKFDERNTKSNTATRNDQRSECCKSSKGFYTWCPNNRCSTVHCDPKVSAMSFKCWIAAWTKRRNKSW